MGSEMCIRDRRRPVRIGGPDAAGDACRDDLGTRGPEVLENVLRICLLYTSDAADERSSVDLGGRRIIKKKTTREIGVGGTRDIRKQTDSGWILDEDWRR